MELKYSEFNSKIFNRNWYTLLMEQKDFIALSSDPDTLKKFILSKKNIEYVDIRIDSSFMKYEKIFKINKFRKSSVQINFILNLKDIPDINLKSEDIKIKQNFDHDTIISIASTGCKLFKFDRYNMDERLDSLQVQSLYKQWIINSFSNPQIIKFLIRKSFCTIKIINSNLKVDLIGVQIEHQKKGIGTKLIQEITLYGNRNKYKNLLVTTETENLAAVKFYLKNNFKIDCFTSCFHLDVHSIK